MRTRAGLRHFGAMMTLAALLSTAACGKLIFDQEGDCSVSHRLSFRYDWNIKFADAFQAEVRSVSVYAFDKEGVLVWQKSEKGQMLEAEDYSMALDLPSGEYDLIAWCGLDSDSGRAGSFTIPTMRVGSSRKEELVCTLDRKRGADGLAFSDSDLPGLYHGSLSVEIKDESDPGVLPGVYEFEMPLMKDTNHIRVILQHLSGQDLDADDFSFTVEDANGKLDFDNSLMEDEPILYRNWSSLSGKAGVETESQAVTSVSVAVADLTIGRMMADRPMMLTIRNIKEDKTVVRIPLTDYALLVKENYGRTMDSQEYLDRQDEYALTFFLDESRSWLDTFIYVNSWRIVLNKTELD